MSELTNIKAGDIVMGRQARSVGLPNRLYDLGKIERVTKTLFFVKGKDARYRKSDGRAILPEERNRSDDDFFYWEPYDEAKYEDSQQRRARQKARRSLFSRLEALTQSKTLGSLTDEQVQSMGEHLDSLERKDPDK